MSSPARAATPLALVVLAIAGLAYAYFFDRGTVSDADREARQRDVFPTFQVDLVRRLELSHGQETLVLERTEGPGATWTLGSLGSARRETADPSAVESLLRDLELARRVRSVPKETSLGDVRVRGRVTVGRVQYVFALAGDAPAPRGGAYMTLLGEPPFVVEAALKVQLLRTADSYRVRSLVRYAESETQRVERTSGAEKLTLERVGSAFRVGGPTGPRASRAAVDRIFGALADARAETFLDDSEAARATGHTLRAVSIIPRDATKPRVDIAIGGSCPAPPGDVAVAGAGSTRTVACVARGTLDALDAAPDDVVDKALISARPDEIEELDLSSSSPDGLHLNLARRGSGWHLRAPQDRELGAEEADAANTLVTAMAGARALAVQSPPPAERFTIRSRATFIRTGAGSSETLEISAPDASGIARARRLDDGAILLLSRAVARRFDPHPIALRGRAAWTTPFDPSSVVAVDDTCTPEPQRIELSEGRWTMRAPAGQPVDVAYAMDLVEALVRAKADGWVAESDDGTFGFGADACRVTLALAPRDPGGDAPSRTILFGAFGAEAEGGAYARTLDGPEVFLAPASLRALARHPAIDRSRFRIDASPGARATLSHDHMKIALSSAGGVFVRSERAEAGDDPVGAALVGLYARDAVHAGPPAAGEGFDSPTLEIQVAGRGEGAASGRRIVIGARMANAGDGYFARVSGVDATFAVGDRTVDALLAGW
jgi:hypothetical protein